MKQHKRLQVAGYTLFEMLISLALLALVITLVITTGTQATKMQQALEEEGLLMNEGRTFMHLLNRDLKNASSAPILFRNQSDFFFLTRNTNDDLVAVGYLFDPQKKNDCYRFVATAKETLAANQDGKLKELYDLAAPNEEHCKLLATHLLSCEIIPCWKNEKTINLLEINLSLGKTEPRYFLSTVISVQR